MELKQFIKETIIQITDGILEAQTALKGKDVIVNPGATFGKSGDLWIGKEQERGPVLRRVQEVEMQVGLTTTEETAGDGHVKIGIGVLSANVGLEDKGHEKTENYVKFCIPVSFPIADNSYE